MVRVTCSCGWPGLKCENEQDAGAAYAKHVGHREQKERPRLDVSLDARDAGIGVEMLLDSARFPAIHLH